MDMLVQPGGVSVMVSPRGRGWSADDVAQRMVEKIIQVSDEAPQPIRDQALAYRTRLLSLCAFYLAEAQRSERTTMAGKLRDAGLHEAATLVGRI